MDVSTKLKNLRKKNNLTLKELSLKSGISVSFISDIENKRRNPSIETLKTLADALGVKVAEFFDGKEPQQNEKPIKQLNKTLKENKIETIAAHFEGEEFTDEDVEDIENFIKFIISKKRK